jgi:glycosyltransferase involved in cell wall biosynthesis
LLPEPAVTALLIGGNAPKHGLPRPHAALAFGRVEHASIKRLLLSAADCFVHPAPVDNLPNVVLEALACATPIVAFPVGGLPDMVRPDTTGWLAVDVSASALAAALRLALAELPSVERSAACRRVVTSEYAMELQAQRYEALIAGDRSDLL